MAQLPASHTYHTHEGDLDVLVRGVHAGQDPGHRLSVLERQVHLVDDAVGAFGARDEAHLERRWVAGDEEVGVEAEEVRSADTAGRSGDVVDVGGWDHGGHGGGRVFGLEFHWWDSVSDSCF